MREQFLKIIPRPKIKTSISVNSLFWFSLILSLILITLFFLLEAQIINLRAKEKEIEQGLELSSLEKNLIEKAKVAAENINLFSKLFQEHKYTSKFLDFLKTLSHSYAQFTSLGLNNNTFFATLKGRTKNFQTLGEQILFFQQDKNIENFQISEIGLNREGKVEFKFTFNFSPQLLKK